MAALETKHVPGRDAGRVLLYALSTCAWCKKTKRLLNELGVEYHYVDVDLLDADGKAEAKEAARRWNPKGSFPTIVVNDEKCISGYDEGEIRRTLGP